MQCISLLLVILIGYASANTSSAAVETDVKTAGAESKPEDPNAEAIEQQTSKPKPNVLLVLADDLGWANLGNRAGSGNGSTIASEAQTPNIDELVASGIRLNRFYTYNYCSPSRASLQSGRLPVHVSFNNDDPTTYNPSEPDTGFAGIPRNMTGIAQKMKSVGYKTHMTGKWDAGMATWEHTPMGRGYDTFFGYYHHANDYYSETLPLAATGSKDICTNQGLTLVDLWNTTGPATLANGTAYEEDLFAAETLGVIRRHDSAQPLFLFHAFHIVHTPLEVPEEYEQRFSFLKNKDRRKYAAMVSHMDNSMGSFVAALQAKGMWENTLVIFSSDNGGPIYGIDIPGVLTVHGAANNIPLRGGKLSDWEGGIRVNAFVSGGFIPVGRRGSELDAYIHIADWYATLCSIVGVSADDASAKAAGLPAVDSQDQWPVLAGDSPSVRDEIHISQWTLISADYKLLTGAHNPGFLKNLPDPCQKPGEVSFYGYWPGWGVGTMYKTITECRDCSGGCLYDIRADPYETTDLALSQPSQLQKMLARLAELNKSIFLPDRGNQSMLACHVAQTKYGGFYGPFVEV